jgi:hypothetical protein
MPAKFTSKSYWGPTPVKLRKIGDTLLGVFSLTSTAAIINDNKQLAVWSLVIGVVGKILTNFFTEEPIKHDDPAGEV